MQEQRRRWEQGTPTLVEALLVQHTDLRNQKDALLDLINHEIVLRTEFDAPPKREEYLERFPDLKIDLLMLFEVHEAIEADSLTDAVALGAGGSPEALANEWPRLPNYQVIGVLGEGGMGIVYKALDERLKRPVALKMIRGSWAGTVERQRFQAEAEAIAKLDHPGIVHIYEVGESDRQPYFALEYLDGGSLSSHLNGVPQAPIAAARLIETLARSVNYAHGLGVIHRDLKPANILMQKVGASPAQIDDSSYWVREGTAYLPKIADFGLAKQVQHDCDATQTQAIVGTPSYMAPEQAGDFARRIGPAADVYSLGAILYEMLTGRPPFRGATVLDTLDQVRTQDPIAPTRLQPKVPRDLETICLKCLRKDPAQRYASADALADDLGRWVRHEPIRARPTSSLEHFRMWCQRHPAVASLSALVVSILVIAFVLVTYFLFWALDERATALKREAQSNAQLYDERISRAHDYWQKTKCQRMLSVLHSMRPQAGEPDLRDFEWHYLWGLLHQEFARVEADSCLAYSPDGTLLAAGVGHEVHLWKAADLEKPHPLPIAKLKGHSNDLVSIAFSPKADLLLSAAMDGTVRVWDLAQQKTVQMLSAHPAAVTSVAFHPLDGSMATACRDGVVRLWEPDGAKRLDLDEHTKSVNDIAFSPDGKRIASASTDETVILWDVATGDLLHKLQGHTDVVSCVAFDGRRIASAGWDRAIRIWDIEKGTLTHTFPKMPQFIPRLAFRPDGKRLAAACLDQTIHVWNTDPTIEKLPHEATLLIRGHTGPVHSVAFSSSGDRLATVSRSDRTMRLWNPNRNQDSQVHDLPTTGNSLALSPQRSVVAVAGSDKNVHLWNWQTDARQVLTGHTGAVHAVAFAGDGTLASAGEDGKIRVWNIDQGQVLRELSGTGKPIVALDFHPGGHRLASAGQDGVVQFWEAAGGRPLHQGPTHKSPVKLAFSPTGHLLASAGAEGSIVICAADTGQERQRFNDPSRMPLALAFSADGEHLAASDKQATIRIWNLLTGKRIYLLEGHDGPAQSLSFSSNGKRLASAGGIGDGTVKLWDLTTGLELLTLRGHGREVNGVIFAKDAAALISLGRMSIYQGQSQFRVWQTTPAPDQ